MIGIFDRAGRHVRLGREIGRGGEGSIFEVASSNRLAAKLYHQPMTPQQVGKLSWMVSQPPAWTEGLLAWPSELLFDRAGHPAGFLMPRFTGCRDIHLLYTPSSRTRCFPEADWRFLLRVAANAARAVATVHAIGCVIGDLNHGSVLVANDATVRLIDCDSFQLSGNGGRFPCQVGVPEFTPPELIDKPFAGIVRTPDHDNYALAVLIFLLLFMGRHPWAHGDSAIASGGASPFRNPTQCAPLLASVPGALPLQTVGGVGNLFAAGLGIGRRPTARDWIDALAALSDQSVQCQGDRSHWHPRFLTSCPWCDIERGSGVSFFVDARPVEVGDLGIDQLWRELSKIPHPGPLPVLPLPVVLPSPNALALRRRQKTQTILGPIVAVVFAVAVLGFALPPPLIPAAAAAGYLLVRLLLPMQRSMNDLVSRRDQARRRCTELEKVWREQAGPRAFERKLGEIHGLRRQLEGLPATRSAKLQKLQAEARAQKLGRFLEQKRISQATIPGLGPVRRRELRVHGIETASEITLSRLRLVKGIGRKLAKELLKWRQSQEALFIYRPDVATAVRDEARVDRDLATERLRLSRSLFNSIRKLRNIGDRVAAARSAFRCRVETARRNYEQTRLDLDTSRQVRFFK